VSSIDVVTETFYLTDHEKFLLLESAVGEEFSLPGQNTSRSKWSLLTVKIKSSLQIRNNWSRSKAAKKEFDEQGI
jgi:hypothetical protein